MPLGRILVGMGVVDERTLRSALARKLGIRFVGLTGFEFDSQATLLIDAAFAATHRLMPLCMNEGALRGRSA